MVLPYSYAFTVGVNSDLEAIIYLQQKRINLLALYHRTQPYAELITSMNEISRTNGGHQQWNKACPAANSQQLKAINREANYRFRRMLEFRQPLPVALSPTDNPAEETRNTLFN